VLHSGSSTTCSPAQAAIRRPASIQGSSQPLNYSMLSTGQGPGISTTYSQRHVTHMPPCLSFFTPCSALPCFVKHPLLLLVRWARQRGRETLDAPADFTAATHIHCHAITTIVPQQFAACTPASPHAQTHLSFVGQQLPCQHITTQVAARAPAPAACPTPGVAGAGTEGQALPLEPSLLRQPAARLQQRPEV
jgi:hypothetical protein